MSHAAPHLPIDPLQARLPTGHPLQRLPLLGLLVGSGALGASIGLAAAENQAEAFYFSYLVAFLFWLSISLGGLFFVILQFAARAGWSVVVRRVAEQTAATLPLFALLFVPIVLGLHALYPWTHAASVAADPALQGKQGYLNEPFFFLRAALFLGIWSALALYYRGRSLRQDRSGDHDLTRRLQRMAGPALILFGLSVTFAAFDWLMSLNPHWYSTIFGVYYFAGSTVAIFAFLALVLLILRTKGPLQGLATADHLHDIGKLLFGFTVFWSYIAFSQYFLQWYGNLPEETAWYAVRLSGNWQTLSLGLAIGHFVVPFFFLMPRAVKRSGAGLAIAALWLLAMHFLDLYWLVMPSIYQADPQPTLLDATTWLAVGGLFLAAFGWSLRRHPVIPLRDPRLVESLTLDQG